MHKSLPLFAMVLGCLISVACSSGDYGDGDDGADASNVFGDAATGSAAGDRRQEAGAPSGDAAAAGDEGQEGGASSADGSSVDGPGSGDASTEGDSAASAMDGSVLDETDGGGVVTGWTSTDGGLVVVREGGVVIEEDDGTTIVCYETTCDGRLLECGDCVDNDDDGKVDWRDRECLGPCDNTEGPALIAGVGGVTGSTCHVDCYFDYGNGPGTGSDDCWWDHRCDPLEPEAPLCSYNETGVRNPRMCPDDQAQTCTDICLPYTPNGCDCFGCCTFPELAGQGEDGRDLYVWIGAKDDSNNGTCTFDDVLDREKCPACTPVPGCLNECSPCEVCVGKPIPDATCFQRLDGGTIPDGGYVVTDQCPEAVVPCGLPGQAICDPGYYCISGCCVQNILE